MFPERLSRSAQLYYSSREWYADFSFAMEAATARAKMTIATPVGHRISADSLRSLIYKAGIPSKSREREHG